MLKAPIAPNFIKTLQVAANSLTITIAPINKKNPGPASAAKNPPSFSVVVRDVPQDIAPEEIATLCPSLSIVKAWSIVSGKTNTIIKSLITFMTKTLFDLFSMQRSKIQTILENTSKSVFNVVTKVSHPVHKIHLTFDQ
jgi:hypothetical protein